MKMKCFLLLFMLCASTPRLLAQKTDSLPKKLEWLRDAKLGIFIHWGIYAVEGTSESWSFHNRTTTYPFYMGQLKGFTAERYNPEEWAQLIRESGARYAVVTTQHHDGVALWNTQQLTPTTPYSLNAGEPLTLGKHTLWNPNKPLSTVAQTPAKRDLIAPLVTALRKQNIRFGAYYSLLDWSHNDYNGFFKDQTRYKIEEDSTRWKRYLGFMHKQIEELNTQFHPDLYWFDGDWEHSEKEWDADWIRSSILATNPNAILNGRLKGYGDYATPEQNMPITQPTKPVWELCMTSNDNWGYRPSDTNMKTSNEVIQIFSECLGMGGNLLLDIGPKADGTIPNEQVMLLKALGRWTSKHAEAIYGTQKGLPYGHFHGPSTLSTDSSTLYLFLTNLAASSPINDTATYKMNVMLRGLSSEIQSAEVLGNGTHVPFKIVGKIDWSVVPGTVFFSVPLSTLDSELTVLKVTLKAPLKLYRGQGGFN